MNLMAEVGASYEIGEFQRPLDMETAGVEWEVSGRSLNVQVWIEALPPSPSEADPRHGDRAQCVRADRCRSLE